MPRRRHTSDLAGTRSFGLAGLFKPAKRVKRKRVWKSKSARKGAKKLFFLANRLIKKGLSRKAAFAKAKSKIIRKGFKRISGKKKRAKAIPDFGSPIPAKKKVYRAAKRRRGPLRLKKSRAEKLEDRFGPNPQIGYG